MGVRQVLDEFISGTLEFGRITASSIASAASSLVATVRVDEDSDTVAEEMPNQEVWGEAALLWQPADPDSSGGPEAIVWRRGDELVIVASKDRRWQVSLQKGEVCIRALGASPAAKILLKPNGDIELDGEKVLVGGTAATQFLAFGDAIQTHFGDIKTWLDAHVHPGVLAGAASTGVATPPSPVVPTVKSSKHKVE